MQRQQAARQCRALTSRSGGGVRQFRPALPLRRARRSTLAARAGAAAAGIDGAAAAAAAADPFSFSAIVGAPDDGLRSFDEMRQAMRQFDRDMDSLFWGAGRSPFAEAEREFERAFRRADDLAAQARRQAADAAAERGTATGGNNINNNNVRVERSESRAPGAYRYYERIEINGGGGGAWAQPAPLAAAAAPPPLVLLAALVAAGAYAALTAAFARNFDLTLYAARDKLRLALTWPLLLLTSRSFRAQFVTAVLRGERVRVTPGVAPGGAAAAAALSSAAAGGEAGPVGGGGALVKQQKQQQEEGGGGEGGASGAQRRK